MFRNYLMTALRQFRSQKAFALINLAGLTLGMVSFMLIALYVQYELNFESTHERADRIYRVVSRQPGNVYLGTDHFAVTQRPLGAAIVDLFPEVEAAMTIRGAGRQLFKAEDRVFFESGLLWADPTIFDILTVPLLSGNPATALAEPYTVLLSPQVAARFFPEQDPIGKTIFYKSEFPLKVVGVLAPPAKNSHLQFTMLSSFATLEAIRNNPRTYSNWGNSSWYTYILLREGHDAAAFDAKLPLISEKHLADREPREGHDAAYAFYLQPLRDIHLHSRVNFEFSENSDARYVYMLSALAILILGIACINYMNLATARAAERTREVGMRKVVGASRTQLKIQFLGESLLLTICATTLAWIAVALMLNGFSTLVERELTIDLLLQGQTVVILLGAMLVTGLIAGGYPSFYLAALHPARVLKGKRGRPQRTRLRTGLVVLQFAASAALIVGTLAIFQQIEFIRSKNLGFNREHVVVLPLRRQSISDKLDVLRRELRQHSGIQNVSISGHLPTNISSQNGARWLLNGEGIRMPSYTTQVDTAFLNVFEIDLVAGRNFSHESANDSIQAILINETLRDALGWENPVGLLFERSGTPTRIIGVMRDFHMHSMRQEIKPLFLRLGDGWAGYVAARVRTSDIPGVIDHMQGVWAGLAIDIPFDYYFLDEAFEKLYASEQKLATLLALFTILAIGIACLGLFGLASFTAVQKTKEIGIRKVLGATGAQIVMLLCSRLTLQVILANVIAWPVAWYGASLWLQQFAYRISPGPTLFVMTLLLGLLIALTTISFQALRAARANPVEALRYE